MCLEFIDEEQYSLTHSLSFTAPQTDTSKPAFHNSTHMVPCSTPHVHVLSERDSAVSNHWNGNFIGYIFGEITKTNTLTSSLYIHVYIIAQHMLHFHHLNRIKCYVHIVKDFLFDSKKEKILVKMKLVKLCSNLKLSQVSDTEPLHV